MATQEEPPKLDHIAPQWFQERWDALIEWCKNNRVVEGLNVKVSDADGGGKRIDALAGVSSSSSSSSSFFKVSKVTVGGVQMVKVSLNSWVMKSIRCSDKLVLTGLDDPFVIGLDEFIWVEALYKEDEEEIDTVSIRHGVPADEGWPNYDEPAEFDSEVEEDEENRRQTSALRLIAYTQSMDYDEEESTHPTGDPANFPDRVTLNIGTVDDPEIIQVVQCLDCNLVFCAQTCWEARTIGALQDYHHVPAPEPEEP